jgi:hypothetical protein
MARGPSRQRNAVSFPIRRGHPPKCGAGASVMWRGCLCAPRWQARPQSCAEHERAGPRTGCPHARGAIPGGHHAHALRASRRRMSGAGDRPPVRSTALRGCDAHQGSDPYRGEAYGVAGAGLPRQTPTRGWACGASYLVGGNGTGFAAANPYSGLVPGIWAGETVAGLRQHTPTERLRGWAGPSPGASSMRSRPWLGAGDSSSGRG